MNVDNDKNRTRGYFERFVVVLRSRRLLILSNKYIDYYVTTQLFAWDDSSALRRFSLLLGVYNLSR